MSTWFHSATPLIKAMYCTCRWGLYGLYRQLQHWQRLWSYNYTCVYVPRILCICLYVYIRYYAVPCPLWSSTDSVLLICHRGISPRDWPRVHTASSKSCGTGREQVSSYHMLANWVLSHARLTERPEVSAGRLVSADYTKLHVHEVVTHYFESFWTLLWWAHKDDIGHWLLHLSTPANINNEYSYKSMPFCISRPHPS